MNSAIKYGLAVVLGCIAICPGADTWIYKTEIPTPRGVVSGCTFEDTVYVIGGAPTASSTTPVTEVYHPETDSWTQMADMPAARCGHATCVVDGSIYVFGGISPDVYSTAKSNVFVYDPSTDTWRQKANMPYANALCGVAVVDGIIYLMGGSRSVSSPPIATVMAYDPVTETWSQKADMPTARFWLSACAVNGKIYAIGGCTENWGTFSYPHVEVYDPFTDTWSRQSDMPTARFGLGTCVVDGTIYAIGGHMPSGATTVNEAYDPATDTWTTSIPMQHKRLGYVLAAVGDRIYAFGGSYPNPGPTILSTVEEFDTGLGVPSPDLNGDFVVDIKDLILLIESWGQSDPCFDIAPPPFGDGITDVQDLEFLMSFWGQEVDDPTLIVHWRLDETEGIIAYDSARHHDGTVCGDPVWLPDAGADGGALALDGDEDSVAADFVLDPSEGPFSVLMWIKGGTPGQAIISQTDGVNWLMADTLDGTLATGLIPPPGRTTVPPLVSDAVITDGAWHRVGFVWDGATRALYVDEVLVAEDVQDALAGCLGDMNIGCDKDMTPGSFWEGLIDDVRIYNRAVRP